MDEEQSIDNFEKDYAETRETMRQMYHYCRDHGRLDLFSGKVIEMLYELIASGVAADLAEYTILRMMPKESRYLYPKNVQNLGFGAN